jgi:hypothetical protein
LRSSFFVSPNICIKSSTKTHAFGGGGLKYTLPRRKFYGLLPLLKIFTNPKRKFKKKNFIPPLYIFFLNPLSPPLPSRCTSYVLSICIAKTLLCIITQANEENTQTKKTDKILKYKLTSFHRKV